MKRLNTNWAKVEASLTPAERVSLELLRSSAAIIGAAQRNGYLDAALNQTARGRTAGKLRGFQADVVRGWGDIEEEVQFWRGPAAVACAEHLGIRYIDSSDLLGRLDDGADRSPRVRRPTKDRIWCNREAWQRLRDSNVTGSVWAVYFALLGRCSQGQRVEIRAEELFDITGFAIMTVNQCLNALQELGMVAVFHRGSRPRRFLILI